MNDFDKKVKKLFKEKIKGSQEYYDSLNDTLEKLHKEKNEKKNIFFVYLPRIVALVILTIGLGTYAYTEIKESQKMKQNISEIGDNKYYDTREMEWSNNFEYLRITNFEEYNKYKDTFELAEMTEEDFENEFVFIILISGKCYIRDITADDNTLYVNIITNFEEKDKTKRVISTKISKEINRENVEILEYPLENYGNNIPIEILIKNNYTKDEAIADGCIVTEYNMDDYKTYLISNNEDKINEFIKATESGESRTIRIINYGMTTINYSDIKYENGIYKCYTYQKLLQNENDIYNYTEGDRSYYKEGTRIEKSFNELNKNYEYSIVSDKPEEWPETLEHQPYIFLEYIKL